MGKVAGMRAAGTHGLENGRGRWETEGHSVPVAESESQTSHVTVRGEGQDVSFSAKQGYSSGRHSS